jgi:hypothetical protein
MSRLNSQGRLSRKQFQTFQWFNRCAWFHVQTSAFQRYAQFNARRRFKSSSKASLTMSGKTG